MNAQRWEEIQASFDELVELEASARAGRLAVLASTDPELRRALESLLAADAEASERLVPLEAGFASQPHAALDPLGLAGRAVSHFQVHEPIGAGGMGVVYRAEDTRLGRPVALKFLSPAYTLDAVAKARFLREAHSAAALDHPNLCTLHEVGTSDDGWLFMAMALYDGETLRARLVREGPLAVPEACEIARQIAAGLQAAHAAGIVHRDLKPGNIMLLPDGTVRILDFGLAKARDQSLTETGAVVGTVSYMAPEQILGETVDGRADLWALGVVLYEMLTKRVPFDGEQAVAIAHAILNNDPAPLSSRRGDVPLVVEDVVLRLLEKNPDKRYASAAELLENLARVPPTARARDSLRRQLRRGSRMLSRNRARLLPAAATIVLTGAAAYGAVALNGGSPATAPRMAIAVLPFRNLSADSSHAYFVRGLQEEILSQLSKIRGLTPIGPNSVMGYAGPKAPPIKQIARELGVGSVVDASVQIVGNRVRVNVRLVDAETEMPLWVEPYDRTLDDAFALQSDIAHQIVATVGASLTDSERNAMGRVPTSKKEAYLLYLQGREIERRPGDDQAKFEAAGRLYEQAIQLDSGFALAHAALSTNHGSLYWRRYDMTAARLARQRAEAETALRLAPNLPEAHEAMAAVYHVGPDTDLQEAIKHTQIALKGAPNDARLWKGVAGFYRRTANWEEYEKAFLKAVELDPRDVDFLSDYGAWTHQRMGRYADAIRWMDRVANLRRDTLPSLGKAFAYVSWKGQMDSLRAWMNGPAAQLVRRNGQIYPRMNFLYWDRQPDSLLQLLKEARQPVFQDALIFEPVALWSAMAHDLRGDSAAARAAYDSALVVVDSALKKYPDDWPLHDARGLALAGLGRRAEALAEVREMRESFIYREDLFLREFILLGIARIHAKLGDADATVDVLKQMLSQRHTGLTAHYLRLGPDWDRVRTHPRFQALITKAAKHPNLRS